jgi:UDP-N-acetylglucosamine 2-epimerase (non-hydrolysing)
MKQIIQNYKSGTIRLEEVPAPLPKLGGVLVRNIASVVSLGTERSIIDIGKKSLVGEAPSLGKPVLVMRQTTERPEAIDAGVAKIVGTARESIINSVELLLGDTKEYRKMASHKNPFGDGKASERIVNILLGRPYKPFKPDWR